MKTWGYGLLLIYFAAKTYARYYLYQPVPARPAVTRSNDALHLLDLVSWLALIGAFFFVLNPDRPAFAIGLLVVAVTYDPVIRFVCLQFEIWRLRARSRNHKWRYREARRHVCRRAKGASFH